MIHESLLGLSPQGRPKHATGLLTEVERAADAAGGWGCVDLITVGLGPGSFTGLRIGIATARGIAAARSLPARGVGSLDALARGIGEAGAEGERLWEPAVYRPEGLASRLGELGGPPAVAGSGAVRFRQELSREGVRIADDADPVHRVAARHICAIAAAAADGAADQLTPIYLRPPDAERWRERDSLQRAE